MSAGPESKSGDEARARQLREEADTYGFVYTCEACVHFAPADTPPRCSLGYPLNLAPDQRAAEAGPILAEDDWTFCKYFELN